MQAQISSQIQNAIDNAIPSLVDASVRIICGVNSSCHPAQVQSSSVPEQQHQLYLAMKADPLLQQQDIAIWLALQMKFEKIQVSTRGIIGQKRQKNIGSMKQMNDSYASDEDEIPTKQVNTRHQEEISLQIDDAKLKKMAADS
ncbi:hypothetical protein Tco_0658454 [Tanacetum coccineum]